MSTKPIRTIYIAGNRWEIHKLTPALNKKFLKLLKETRQNITLRGFCMPWEKRIYVRPGQSPQDEGNTLMHEGLHAMLSEIGCVHGISHATHDEKTVTHLSAEILGYLKQVDLMPA